MAGGVLLLVEIFIFRGMSPPCAAVLVYDPGPFGPSPVVCCGTWGASFCRVNLRMAGLVGGVPVLAGLRWGCRGQARGGLARSGAGVAGRLLLKIRHLRSERSRLGRQGRLKAGELRRNDRDLVFQVEVLSRGLRNHFAVGEVVVQVAVW